MQECLPVFPYDLCPLKVALQLDHHTRTLLHDNNGRALHMDIFNAEILRTVFLFIRNRDQILLDFLVGGWFNIHEEYLVHPHFHHANIQVACSIKDFITVREISANDSNSDSDVSKKAVGDDTQHSSIIDDAMEGVSVNNGEMNEDANEIDNNADFEVANDVAVNHSCVTEQFTRPVMNTTTPKKCDWHEIGMCVVIGKEAEDKCQDSLGRCNNYIHHLCQITYVEKSGLPKSTRLLNYAVHTVPIIGRYWTVQRLSHHQRIWFR